MQCIVLHQVGRVYRVCGVGGCVCGCVGGWTSSEKAHMVNGKGDTTKRNLGYGRWCKSYNGACRMGEVKFNLRI